MMQWRQAGYSRVSSARLGGCGALSIPVSGLALFRAKLVEIRFGEAER
jgi:hypothetical protein